MSLFREKVEFIRFIVRHELIKDKVTDDLFRFLLLNKEYLDKIDFSKGKTKVKYKYKLLLNLRKGTFILETNGKKYQDKALLRSIMRLIRIVSLGRLCICIMDKLNTIIKKLEKACYSYGMINDLIFDAFIDFTLKEERKRNILNQIDQSLDSKNKEEFEFLINEYKKLVK